MWQKNGHPNKANWKTPKYDRALAPRKDSQFDYNTVTRIKCSPICKEIIKQCPHLTKIFDLSKKYPILRKRSLFSLKEKQNYL